MLMLSRFFPPRFDVGGKRAHRFATYLPQHQWRPVVVTGRMPPSERRDPSARMPPEAVVERVYEPWWWKEPAQRGTDGTLKAPTGTRPKRRRLITLPVGQDLHTVPHLVRAAFKVGRREKVSAVWATSSPYSVLPAGAAVAKLLDVPLLLDLRDPWTLNFMHAKREPWLQGLDQRIERSLFERANKVIFTATSATEAYRKLYPHLPEDRLITIRNAFDPQQAPPQPEGALEGPIRLVHFGNCYGPRRLEAVLRAMAKVRAEGVSEGEEAAIVLENFGRVADEDLRLARELGLSEALRSRPFVPFAQGLEELTRCDLAVLLAYGEETLYVPAKFYDYLLARAPILALTRRGELAEMVEQSGSGRALGPRDVEGTAQLLRTAIAARAQGRRAFTPHEEAREAYSAHRATEELARILDQTAK